MDAYSQIRTSRGQYPSRYADWIPGVDGGPGRIGFSFCAPEDLSFDKGGQAGSSKVDASLASLAFFRNDQAQMDRGLLTRVAAETGPLYGKAQYEQVVDWLVESDMIASVIAVQQAINDGFAGFSDGMDADDDFPVAKMLIKAKGVGLFHLYSLSVSLYSGVTEAFFRNMPSFPCFKRFSAPGVYDYAVFDLDEDEDGRFISVNLLCFRNEITSADFMAAMEALGMPVGGPEHEMLMNQAGFEDVGSLAGQPGLGGQLEWKPEGMGKVDAPHLEKLVQAVISLRLQGIGIDVFASSEQDDFMVFPSYISYLWYRFSCELGQVRIGVCERCGRGFSLVGHRGAERRFCGEKCKNDAKNARTAKERDDARRLFLEQGLSVKETAQAVYGWKLIGGEADGSIGVITLEAAMKQVRKNLKGYPKLKQNLDKDLKAGRGAPFARRCLKEGVFAPEQIATRAKKLGIGR